MNSSSERLFHLVDTLSEMPGISFKKWSYDKARVKTICEFVYACKLVKARELQFLGGGVSGDPFQVIYYAERREPLRVSEVNISSLVVCLYKK